jgi:integrase
LRGTRYRALLLLGFSGTFRRSELAALKVEDVTEAAQGLDLRIRRSKTDQEGLGQSVSIPKASNPWCCPLQALREWQEQAGISEGPLFRRLGKGGRVFEQAISPHSIAQMVKRYAASGRLQAEEISAHSLRAGWITSAAEKGASVFKLREVSRHKSLEVLADYVRRADRFKDHAGAGLLG